jgi:hypothetical protein
MDSVHGQSREKTMNKYRVYRPNMQDYYVVTGTHMAINNEGSSVIYNGDNIVAVISKIVSVILEQN